MHCSYTADLSQGGQVQRELKRTSLTHSENGIIATISERKLVNAMIMKEVVDELHIILQSRECEVLLVDFRNVHFMLTGFLDPLVEMLHKQTARMIVFGLSPEVEQGFRLKHLTVRSITIVPTQFEAVALVPS